MAPSGFLLHIFVLLEIMNQSLDVVRKGIILAVLDTL